MKIGDKVKIIANIWPLPKSKQYNKYVGTTGTIIDTMDGDYKIEYDNKRFRPRYGWWFAEELAKED